MKQKAAVLAGASGLIGRELLHDLLGSEEYDQVIALVRRTLGITNPKLKEIIVDFTNLKKYQEAFAVDDVFCCLGTTIKKAKTRAAFEQVDLTYPLELAHTSRAMGAKKFLLVSSVGADPESRIFYSRVKGTLEHHLKQVGFEELHIFQPSLLLGKRVQTRRGEEAAAYLAKRMLFLFKGPLRKYTPIKAQVVALGMYKAAQQAKPGIHYYQFDEIIMAAHQIDQK